MAFTPRFRLLPLTTLTLVALLATKAYNVYVDTNAVLIGEAYAKGDDEGKTEDVASKDEEKPSDGAAAEGATASKKDDGEEEKAGKEKADEDKNGEKKDAEKEGDEKEKAEGEKKEGEGNDKISSTPPTDILAPKKQYSQIEVDLLQSLSARREELGKWEGDIKMKESLLSATETRLDRKLGEIQAMEASLKKLIEQYNQHQDAEIRSLVKIYENMKPVDAAAIFDEMEMPILLLVVDKMSERKAAPVLAAMTPKKAKDLTVELAATRKARDDAVAKAQQQSSLTPPAPR